MNGQYSVGDVVLHNWTLTRLIGEGSYGKVFEARRTDFGAEYNAAIKIIVIPHSDDEITSALAEGMTDSSVSDYFRGFVEELSQEFNLMSKLKGNSYIVSYEDHEVIPHSDGIGWDIIIRMELLTPLLKVLKTEELTRKDVIKLGINICEALELCGKQKIIHRDIKPENIFRSPNGDYKLGDFGIARTVDKTTGGMSKKGTYTYMAPEVYKEEPYGASVDIYSLGIVMYRLLNNNRTPFLPEFPTPIKHADREAALAKRISGEKIPAPAFDNGPLSQIVLKACAYRPEERYKTPTEMKTALEMLLEQGAKEAEEAEEDGTIDLSSKVTELATSTNTGSNSSYREIKSGAEESVEDAHNNTKKKTIVKTAGLLSGIACLAVLGVFLIRSLNGKKMDYQETHTPEPSMSVAAEEYRGIAEDEVTSALKSEDPIQTSMSEEPKKEEHQHDWQEATCTEPKRCRICGETQGDPLGHTIVTDAAKEASCSASGLTEGSHCSRCGTVLVEQEILPLQEHDWQEATCTEPKRCRICGETQGNPLGHTIVTDAAKEASCSATGLTEGSHCSECGAVIRAQQILPALGHAWKKATCTEPEICLVCGASQGYALGHAIVTDEAIEATCEKSGLTEGTHCERCNEIIRAQNVIPALRHDWKEATCDEPRICLVCGEIQGEALGHDIITDEAKAAGCTENGLSQGSHCARCGEVIEEQKIIPATGHNWTKPTCTEPEICLVCGETQGNALGHEWDEAGQYCMRCGDKNENYIASAPEEFTDSADENQKDIELFRLKTKYATYDNKNKHISWIVKEEDKALIIYGKGDMEDYSYSTPWKSSDAEYVIICEGVTSIGDNAFSDMENDVRGIYIPASVSAIGENFIDSEMLESIEISADNQYFSVQDGVLFDKNKEELIKYPSSMPNEEYTVPQSVTYIHDDAFFNTYYLKTINVPDAVSNISAYSINGEPFGRGVEEIRISSDNNYYTSVDGVVYLKDMSMLVVCPYGKNTDKLSVPEGVRSIDEYAFSNVSRVQTVEFPSTLEKIGSNAFKNSVSVKQIIFEGSKLGSIGVSAFEGCTSLEGISIPEGITVIESDTFAMCTKLSSLDLPKSLQKIEVNAFRQCTNLKNVNYQGSKGEKKNLQIGAGNTELQNAEWTFAANPRPFSYLLGSGSATGTSESLLGIHTDWIAYSEDQDTIVVDLAVYADHNRINYSSRGKLTVSLNDSTQTLYTEDINDIRTTLSSTFLGSFTFNMPVDHNERQTVYHLNIDWEYNDEYYVRDGSKVFVSDVICDEQIILTNEKSAADIDVGDTVFFGNYYSAFDGKTSISDKIEWIVAGKKNGKALLLSKYCIDGMPFYSGSSKSTPDWESSTIREWLNASFYNGAFSMDEQAVIVNNYLYTSASAHRTPWSSNTYDRVFLLSDDEFNEYLKGRDFAECGATPYTSEKLILSDNGNSHWWLRSIPASSGFALNVDSHGQIASTSPKVTDTKGIRPAVWINLTNTSAQNETDRTVIYDTTGIPEKGTIVTFGTYEQDNKMDNGNEPLEWIVLGNEGDKVLLLSKYCICCGQNNTNTRNYNGLDRGTWATATLRTVMNGTFMEYAFEKDEQEIIVPVELENDDNPKTLSDGGNKTLDKVFILSLSELKKYLPPEEYKVTATKRSVNFDLPTIKEGEEFRCKWWVRTPGEDNLYAVFVDENGDVNYNGERVDSNKIGIRPALWIDKSYFKSEM